MRQDERSEMLASADILLFEGFRLDRSGLFRLDGAGVATPVALGSRALALLGLLAGRGGELISKDEIMQAVWPHTIVEENNLTVQISALRRLLDPGRAQGSCIQNVPGRGYRFVAPVTRAEPSAPKGRELAKRARLERRLAAILAADVVGYSRLIGADEEGTIERLKALRTELIDLKIAEHRGRVVKRTGDGLLAEFASVVDALRCATELQAAMAQRNSGIPVDQRIELRIGINVGDIVVEGGDIFGDGVNVAARLEGLAQPGEIYVSARVGEDTAGRLDIAFEDLGEQQLRNIARPLRVYRVCRDSVVEPLLPNNNLDLPITKDEGSSGVGAAAEIASALSAPPLPTQRRSQGRVIAAVLGALTLLLILVAASTWRAPWFATGSPVPRLSIVVLPFTNLSEDHEQQYFADAITDDLTTDLSRRAHMYVISRNTASTYKDKPVDAKQIGRELGVRYLLEGSIRRVGNQIRVNAQLAATDTAAYLWAEQFDRDVTDLFAVQSEITRRIGNALNLQIISAEAARPTSDPDAFDYLLRGRVAMFDLTRESYARAITLFERALALDPDSAVIQSWLAGALAGRVVDGLTSSAEEDIARAESLATKALAASPRSGLAHFVNGTILRARKQCGKAISEYETVIALEPSYVRALADLGRCKIFIGPIEDAISAHEQAIRLSPNDAAIGVWYWRLGQAHLLLARTSEAIHWLEKARSVSPGLPFIHAHLASAHGLQGESELAAAELAVARRLGGEGFYASIARVRARVIGLFEVPETRALFEATYLTGLRKAGVPEE